MGYLESQFCQNSKNGFGVNNGKYIEENWQKTVRMEQHNLYSLFFDTMINKSSETNSIWMDIFYKKAHTWRFVTCNSRHPKECKNDIPFAHARRICTIAKSSDVKKENVWTNFKNFYIAKSIHKI